MDSCRREAGHTLSVRFRDFGVHVGQVKKSRKPSYSLLPCDLQPDRLLLSLELLSTQGHCRCALKVAGGAPGSTRELLRPRLAASVCHGGLRCDNTGRPACAARSAAEEVRGLFSCVKGVFPLEVRHGESLNNPLMAKIFGPVADEALVPVRSRKQSPPTVASP